MPDPVTLTPAQREWRREMVEALAKLRTAVRDIDGPFSKMQAAFCAVEELAGLAIDDEDLGPCAHCDEPIWLAARDDYASSEDGETFCMDCARRWQEANHG